MIFPDIPWYPLVYPECLEYYEYLVYLRYVAYIGYTVFKRLIVTDRQTHTHSDRVGSRDAYASKNVTHTHTNIQTNIGGI